MRDHAHPRRFFLVRRVQQCRKAEPFAANSPPTPPPERPPWRTSLSAPRTLEAPPRQARRPLHDEEARALEALDKAPGEDRRRELAGVVFPLAVVEARRERRRVGERRAADRCALGPAAQSHGWPNCADAPAAFGSTAIRAAAARQRQSRRGSFGWARAPHQTKCGETLVARSAASAAQPYACRAGEASTNGTPPRANSRRPAPARERMAHDNPLRVTETGCASPDLITSELKPRVARGASTRHGRPTAPARGAARDCNAHHGHVTPVTHVPVTPNGDLFPRDVFRLVVHA